MEWKELYGPLGTIVVLILGWLLQQWAKRVERRAEERKALKEKAEKEVKDREEWEARRVDVANKVSQAWDPVFDAMSTEMKRINTKCDDCLAELDQAVLRANDAEFRAQQAEQRASDAERRATDAERRADRNDRTAAALIDAWTAALPLLDAGDEATKFLRATIRAARESRYDEVKDA